jgi:site-specific recombinase XerD
MSAPTKITDHFRSWLKARNYSSSTIRNYLVDVNKYLATIPSSDVYSTTALSHYLSTLDDPSYLRRSLASLNKLCQFGLDQNYIRQNPIKKYRQQLSQVPQADLQDILNQYETYLNKKKRSSSTIRNYLNDLQQYINWLLTSPIQNHHPPGPPPLKREATIRKILLQAPLHQGEIPRHSEVEGFRLEIR